MTKNEIRITTICLIGFILIVIALRLISQLNTAQAIEIILTFSLFAVTLFYVKRTAEIANATKQQVQSTATMIQEQMEQRRPIITQEVKQPEVYMNILYSTEKLPSVITDSFIVRNVGNGPAIELEMMVLDKEKKLQESERKTILGTDEKPYEHKPNILNSQLATKCYFVCRYRSVIPSEKAQVWYETWLPFTPKLSQNGNLIYMIVEELEFKTTAKKASY